MPQAARTTDPITPHSPCAPGKCGPGSDNVIIQNLLAYRVGDNTLPHDIPTGSPPVCLPHVTNLVKGSMNVHINNQPAGRVGDTHSCGVAIVSGSDKVIINGSGGSKPSPGWGGTRIQSPSAIITSNTSGPVTVPSDLSDFIKSKEGFSECAYWDNSQYTNGYGTKANSSSECISESEATSRLDADVSIRRNYVEQYGQDNGYNWNSDQINALTSFAFNLGTGSISQVTANGNRSDAVVVEKIKLYNKANGVAVAGLTTRRLEESAWFKQGMLNG